MQITSYLIALQKLPHSVNKLVFVMSPIRQSHIVYDIFILPET